MSISYQGLNVEEMFLTGVPQYPVERTLLATGVIDAVMRSRSQCYVRLKTPYLSELPYCSYQKTLIRPTAPRPPE
jgi:hypothetical protein